MDLFGSALRGSIVVLLCLSVCRSERRRKLRRLPTR